MWPASRHPTSRPPAPRRWWRITAGWPRPSPASATAGRSGSTSGAPMRPGYLPESGFGGCLAAQLVDASRRRQFTDAARPVFQNTAFLAVHYVPQRARCAAGLADGARRVAGQRPSRLLPGEHRSAVQQLAYAMRGVTVPARRRARLLPHGLGHLSSPSRADVPDRRAGATAGRGGVAHGTFARGSTAGTWRPSRSAISARPRRLTSRPCTSCPSSAAGSPPCTASTPTRGARRSARSASAGLTRQNGLGAILTEIVTRNPFAGRTDPEADRALAQLDVMQGELAERPYALAHANVHVWSEDRSRGPGPGEPGRLLLNAQGLDAALATLNNVMAPLGDMPGNVTQEAMNIRRARIELAAITRLAPVTGVSQGSREDWRFGGPALLLGTTRRGVPLYWSLERARLGCGAHRPRRHDRRRQVGPACLHGDAVPALPGGQGHPVRPPPLVHGRLPGHGRGLDRARRRPAMACSRCGPSTGRTSSPGRRTG